jgi:hypothetical protein
VIALHYVIWPEGEPDRAAILTRGSWFKDWLFAFGASMRGRRTCRLKYVRADAMPVVKARKCERGL